MAFDKFAAVFCFAMQKFVGGSARLKFKSFPETSDTMSNSGQLGKHLPAFNEGIRMVILIPRESPLR